jgi:formamidopyrimidine-DNA glycosylase
MPEIVEVKLLADTLNKYLKGRYIKWYKNSGSKVILNFWDKVRDQKFKVTRVYQKGKILIFDLLDQSKKQVYILNELRMTGKWTKEAVSDKTHLRYYIKTSNEKIKRIWYSDYRGFSTFKVMSNEELNKFLASRGPDILAEVTESIFIKQMMQKPKWQIVKAMLDQKLVSGIGNWIKSDALYHAKIDPRKRVDQLTESELKKLYKSVMYVINDSLKKGGSEGYINFNGLAGGYSFLIYDKKEVKEGVVKKIKLTDSRTTHFVPTMFDG